MSTSPNASGQPGRGRDDDAADPTGEQNESRAGGGEATGSDESADAAALAAAGKGEDVTKRIRREAKDADSAVRKGSRDQGREGAGAKDSAGTSGSAKDGSKAAAKRSSGSGSARTSAVPGQEGKDAGVFTRMVLFVRQVFAEIRKVVTPSRQELITYSVVVVVFILAMMAYVGVLDYGIGRLVLWVFGN